MVGRGGPDRGRGGRGHDRAGRRGVDRAAGRLEDGARRRGVVRRQDPPEAVRLARVLPRLPSRPRRPPSAALDAEPRSARAARRSRSRSRSSTAGEIFRSVPLVYPVLAYLLVRGLWVGFGRRGRPLASVWPTWVLAAAAVFLLGFRVGLNLETPRGVIDVGLAGVVGAEPDPRRRGAVREHAAARGPRSPAARRTRRARCASASRRTDAARPRSSAATRTGRSRTSRTCPATSIFGLEREVGLAPCGARHVDRVRPARGPRRSSWSDSDSEGAGSAALLAFGWTAYPFTAYTLNANTNDAIMPAFLLLGFWLVTSDWARGGAGRARGLDEVRRAPRRAAVGDVPVLRAPPRAPRSPPRSPWRRCSRSRSSCSSRRSGMRCGRSGSGRSGSRSGRDSPFSIWGWGQYHAEGIPDLGFLQPVVEVFAVVLALVVALVPRRKGPVELAALTAAVLVAFQLTLTHWFYLYLPWVVPFVLLWLLLPQGRTLRRRRRGRPRSRTPCPSRRRTRPARPRS